MRRWFVRLLVGLTALIVIFVLTVVVALRASLPQLDGEIVTTDIAAPVRIVRDDLGIPTVTAANRQDLAYGLGFAHGQDRFFQMDLIRRQAAGELSAVVGAATIDTDRRMRLHRFRQRAAAAVAGMSEAERAVLEFYSRGVNAGLQSLDAKPFEYYLLAVEPEAWRPEDSMLVAYAMFVDLNDERAERDRQRGLIARVLPLAVMRWLYPTATAWDAPLLGGVPSIAAVPGPELIRLNDKPVQLSGASELGQPPVLGSNNWAVGGALTQSGRAMVSNDMHLGLNVPTIYYRARLKMTGTNVIDVTGVSLPGQPLIIAGSNGSIAWGYTNSNGDWSDAVLLRPGATADSYQTPEGDRAFTTHQETIAVKDAEPVTLTVRETIWGPVDDQANYPDGELAISWIAHHTDATNLGIMQLETATSVDAALAIANTIVMPPQNFVVGDAAGNIAWTIAGRIPQRGSFDPHLPADWSTEHGWLGWLEPTAYPRIVNPDNHRIWSANSRMVEGEALQTIGDGGYAFGARQRQIRDRLLAGDTFTPADMLAIQTDDRAIYMSEWRDVLLAVFAASDELSPALQEYQALVQDWQPAAVADSVGYRLVRAFRNELRRRTFAALTAPIEAAYDEDIELRMSRQFDAPLWSIVKQQPPHLLPANYPSWNDFMLEAAAAVADSMQAPLAARSWGEYNTARITHPLSAAIPWGSKWLDMPAEPLAGDADMPRAQGATWGASERFTVMPGAEEEGLMHLPGGQSGHPLSDFYEAGYLAWVRGEPTPFLPGADRHELILQPETR